MYFFYFYPLGLDRRLTRRPWLSWTLAVTMCVAFIWLRYFPTAFAFDPWDLVFFPGYSPAWTTLTAIFMHAGWFHLLGNLIYFMVFAPPLEDRLGPLRFGFYFLLLGNFGNLAHGLVAALDLLGQGGLGVMGASGAIAGLLSFSLVRFYDARIEVAWWVLAPLAGQNKAGKTRLPLAVGVVLWYLLQVAQAALAKETGAQVSFGAHLGGFALGLLMALALGHLREGRAEAAQVRARRYFRDGHFHAAAGAWSEYLELVPDDSAARLEMARVLKVSGQIQAATRIFRQSYGDLLAAGEVADALKVHDEAVRGGIKLGLGPGEMAQVGFYKEKQLDDLGALDAYRRLYLEYPQHPEGHRALVRVIVLCHGKLGDEAAAQRWLAEARSALPAGGWRDFLEREFNLAAAPGEVAAPPRG